MNVGLLLTGEELLSGETKETNSQRISDALTPLGIKVRTKVVVGDDMQQLISSLKYLLASHPIIITNGGLGPTQDDLTHQALAGLSNKPMLEHPKALACVERYLAKKNLEMNIARRAQAQLPQGVEVLDNSVGTAAGCLLELEFNGEKRWIMTTPGPPRELMPMLNDQITPWIKSKLGIQDLAETWKLTFFGLGESDLQAYISEVLNPDPALLQVSFRLNFPYVELKLTSVSTAPNAIAAQTQALVQLRDHFKSYIIWQSNQTVIQENMASTLIQQLKDQGASLTLAESCTGGLASALICAEAGASEVYPGAVVAYSSGLKTQLLKVAQDTLTEQGAVSAEVAKQMALGALAATKASHAVAFTGIAGPSGATASKSVGTIYIAWGSKTELQVQGFKLGYDRGGFQTMAAHIGLDLLRRRLLDIEDTPIYVQRYGLENQD